MNSRIAAAFVAAVISLSLAAANMTILYYFDKSIGYGKIQVITSSYDADGSSTANWSFGIIPHLQTVSEKEAKAENLRIWARPGDYSGTGVMGITFALSAVMWFIWTRIYFGFPGRVQFARERALGILLAVLLTLVTNLALIRITAEFTNAESLLTASFGYLSLGLNAAGIWYIALISRLGIGQHKNIPSIPASRSTTRKLSALLAGLFAAFALSSLLRAANLSLPYLSVDFAAWAAAIISFLNYYGYSPAKWLKGERPQGLAITIIGTVLSLTIWAGIQHYSGGALGAGMFSAKGSPGFSLMVSLWMLFWLIVSKAAGKSSPIKNY